MVPIGFTILAFALAYFVLTSGGINDEKLKFGIVLALIVSSASVIIAVTVVTVFYRAYWKTVQDDSDSH
ncbi:MAG: hypothetical protein IH932_04775 [Thaumarchaeota archaeon]|nr:hypothetical protein [Nitrososphaerota archaeon]